jgi:hypothetical protein
MPLFVVYASHAALRGHALGARLRGGRGVAAVLLLVFFLAVCVPHFREDGALMWATGSYFE